MAIGFDDFARSCAPSLLRSAILLTGDVHAAEDLAQETLTKLYVAWRRVGSMDDPVAYARVTMTRTFISQRRKRGGNEPAVDTQVDTGGRAALADDPSLRVGIADALDALAPLDRAVLVLRFFEDRTSAQVAHDLGLTPGAVRNRTMRALAVVRPRLVALASETDEPTVERKP